MLTAVYMVGRLGPMDKNLFRKIKVQRPYKEDMKTPTIDVIETMYWSENLSAPFYRGRENQLVSIKGRLEQRDEKVVIIAEQVNFIEKEQDMFKYLGWIIRLLIPAMYHYITWLFRYSRNPQKYPLKLRYNRARGLALVFLRILKVDIKASGKTQLLGVKKFYLIANHVSFLDPVILIAMHEEPISFASKIEVKKFPFVGRLLTSIDGVFLQRNNLKQEIKAMQEIKKSLGDNVVNWVVFPEGTRNKDYDSPLNDFKAGSFKIPAVTDNKIVPIAIWGTQVVLNTHIRWKRYPVFMHYLPVIDPADFSGNTIKLASTCQQLVQAEIDKMRSQHPHLVKDFSKGKDYLKYLR